MKVVLVGECPPPRGDGTPWLGRSGQRVAKLAGLVDAAGGWYAALADALDLRNLYDEPVDFARVGKTYAGRAQGERFARAHAGRALLLGGVGVSQAFGLKDEPLCSWREVEVGGARVLAAVIPHPSGMSRYWNDPAVSEAVSTFLRATLAAPPTLGGPLPAPVPVALTRVRPKEAGPSLTAPQHEPSAEVVERYVDLAVLRGLKVAELAAELRVTTSQVREVLYCPAGRARREQLVREVRERSTARLAQANDAAIDALESIAKGDEYPPEVRVDASVALLDRGGFGKSSDAPAAAPTATAAVVVNVTEREARQILHPYEVDEEKKR